MEYIIKVPDENQQVNESAKNYIKRMLELQPELICEQIEKENPPEKTTKEWFDLYNRFGVEYPETENGKSRIICPQEYHWILHDKFQINHEEFYPYGRDGWSHANLICFSLFVDERVKEQEQKLGNKWLIEGLLIDVSFIQGKAVIHCFDKHVIHQRSIYRKELEKGWSIYLLSETLKIVTKQALEGAKDDLLNVWQSNFGRQLTIKARQIGLTALTTDYFMLQNGFPPISQQEESQEQQVFLEDEHAIFPEKSEEDGLHQ